MKVCAAILIGILSLTKSFGQENYKRLYVTTGGLFRTTIFYLRGLRNLSGGPTINYQVPYSYRAGVNGTGLNSSLGYQLSETLDLNLEWQTTLRYDFYYFDIDCDCHAKTFYVDQALLITKSLFNKYYFGIGYTIYNLGKNLDYLGDDMTQHTLQLQFNSIDIVIGVQVWKLNFEPKLSIVQDDFPGTIKENATLFGTRVYYKFRFRKKGEE
jgi:hypothetical protein